MVKLIGYCTCNDLCGKMVMVKKFVRFVSGIRSPFGKREISSVYFIQLGDDGPVKIGHSDNVKARMRTLQTAHTEKLRLLYSFPGTKADEILLHRKFLSHKISGEWFSPHEDIMGFISRRKSGLTGRNTR